MAALQDDWDLVYCLVKFQFFPTVERTDGNRNGWMLRADKKGGRAMRRVGERREG